MSYWKHYKSKYAKSWKESRGKRGTVFDSFKIRTPKFTASKKRSILTATLYLLGLGVILGFAGVIVLGSIFLWMSKSLPDPASLSYRLVPQSTKIYDRTGKTILYDIYGEEKRTVVSLSQIPERVKQATILIEDREFYQHKGLNWKGIFRAALVDIFAGRKAQGGSSITQQLIKNSILSREKTFTRKIKELILAYRIETKFSKDEILEMYFNEIPYGSTIYGIEAAAQSFFGRPTKDLNPAEIAVLVSLTKAPTYYSPYGNHQDELLNRSHYVLDEMARAGFITDQELEEAKNYNVLKKILPYGEKILAPHFVMYVKEILTEKYSEKILKQGGLKITTTLDMEKQKIAEESIAKYVEKNEKEFKATNAALAALDPKTGQILAMVGSRDFFEPTFGSVNVTLRPRQPGSSFKPVVYSAAFEKGYTPDTILYDVNTVFKTLIEGDYAPKNYDQKERGPVTMKKALAGSLNIPAVKTIYLTGIERVLDLAEKMGYTTFKDRSRFGLSLVLGGGEIKLLEHANAFGVFVRDGIFAPHTAILKIEDSRGNLLEEWQDASKRVLDEEIARSIAGILSDNDARSFIFGLNNYLTLNSRPVAAKTGTTNDFKDAWTIGGTPSLVAGVWAGNNNSKEMKEGDGSKVAAPIWNYFMTEALKETEVEDFSKSAPIIAGKSVLDGQMAFEYAVQIDKASGKLATQYTPKTFIETKRYRQIHNILYYIDKDNPRGPAPENPETDPQSQGWEEGVIKWAQNNGIVPALPPQEYDNLHIPANFPTLEVLNISDGMTVTSQNLEIQTRSSAPRGLRRIEISLDNQLIINSPYSNSIPLSIPSNFSAGLHTLTISVFDDIDNSATGKFSVDLQL